MPPSNTLPLLLLLLLLTPRASPKGQSSFQRFYKSQLKQCQLNYCKSQKIFTVNCQRYCLSPFCYGQVWREEENRNSPVEPGIEDYKDERKFKDCYYEQYIDYQHGPECLARLQAK